MCRLCLLLHLFYTPQESRYQMSTNQSGFLLAFKSWTASWVFMLRHRLSHFLIYPFILSVLLAMGSAVFINRGVKFVMSFINPYFENVTMTGRWWENILEVLMDCSAFAIPFVLWLISIFIFLRLNKYIVLALMSPMMAILSERTNHILTNTSTPFSLNQLIQDSIRGAIISLRNLILELGLTLMIWGFILILMLFLPYLIFILAPLASVLVFFIGSYYYGFAVLDYVNERNQLNVKDSIRDIRSQRSLSIGIGSIFSILFMIPFVGVAVSTVTCTIAASIAKHQQRA